VHKFAWYPSGQPGFRPRLHGAHLLGADGVPVRGEIRLEDGLIVCESHNQDALALSLLWPVRNVGVLQLETTRLLPRDKPYHLHLELARHRLMRISIKREEWGLFDYEGMEDIAQRIDQARERFIAAWKTEHEGLPAAALADESLAVAVAASEQVSRFHADVFLNRRLGAGPLRGVLGVTLPSAATARVPPLDVLREVFEFVRIPFTWRDIQPTEQGSQYDAYDALIKSVTRAGLAVRGGPLVNFSVTSVPDWMYIWENDADTILDMVREHVRRTVQRYSGQVCVWTVVGGIHAENVFPFSFEQIIELTRMAATTVKQIAPRSQLVVELVQPWGEYFARNARTIPTAVYAEMVVQAAIPFDAFGLQFLAGLDTDGFRARDMFQISAMIDRLANLAKPLHLTAVGAPSVSTARSEPDAIQHGGCWHGLWSEEVQGDWLATLCETALSKPYVESVCLAIPVDAPDAVLPSGGVLRSDASPKPAWGRLKKLRARLRADARAEAKR
jgi:hypothetical protein